MCQWRRSSLFRLLILFESFQLFLTAIISFDWLNFFLFLQPFYLYFELLIFLFPYSFHAISEREHRILIKIQMALHIDPDQAHLQPTPYPSKMSYASLVFQRKQLGGASKERHCILRYCCTVILVPSIVQSSKMRIGFLSQRSFYNSICTKRNCLKNYYCWYQEVSSLDCFD